MPNITLPRLTTSYGSVDAINTALTEIESAINDTLSRVGGLPNQMESDIDLNGNRILNLPRPVSQKEPVTLEALQEMSEVVLYIPNPHTHDWTTDITGKPVTFTPAPHTHSLFDVDGLVPSLNGLQSAVNALNLQPKVFVQPTQPVTGELPGDLWFY